MSFANGHPPEVDADLLKPCPPPTRSESDLSDAHDIPVATTSTTTLQEAIHSEDDAIHDMATSELDEDEDAPGEEDADFDEETPPPEHHVNGVHRDRSLSDTSSRPGKRKADIDEQELMEQNPDLYGLRRSVCGSFPHYVTC